MPRLGKPRPRFDSELTAGLRFRRESILVAGESPMTGPEARKSRETVVTRVKMGPTQV
jgi:hypothetical protein